MITKAEYADFAGRFREIICDPLNLLIHRDPRAGLVTDGTVILHNGIAVPIDSPDAYYGAFSEILRLNRGVHEPLEEFAFQQMLTRLDAAPTMLELGAYWGHYSLWLKRIRPDAQVVLVEPDQGNLAVGQSNFHRNGYDAQFIAEMVGERGLGVDRFLDGRDDGRLSILHADIQGCEVEMLQGAARALAERRIEYLFVSTHSQRLHGQTCEILGEHGYRVELAADFENETTSYDGFVFGVSPDLPPVYTGPAPMGRTAIATATPIEILQHMVLMSQG